MTLLADYLDFFLFFFTFDIKTHHTTIAHCIIHTNGCFLLLEAFEQNKVKMLLRGRMRKAKAQIRLRVRAV